MAWRPATYVSQEYQVTYPESDFDAGGLTITATGFITCSVIGPFWNSSPGGGTGPPLIGQKAITLSQNTGTPILNGWVVAPQCSTLTRPSDFNFTELIPTDPDAPQLPYYPDYKTRAICVRPARAPAGTAWNCSPSPSFLNLTASQALSEILNHGDATGYFCTNRDYGFSGNPWP
jgi:hypothetical protein